MGRLNLPEKIDTARTMLQRVRYEDAEEIFYTYASKPEATWFLSWPTHRHIGDTRDFVEKAVANWNNGTDYSYTVRLKETNRLIGSFGVMHEDGKAQFGYVFSPSYWGQGYATEVCRKMMEVLRNEPQLTRIGTFVDVENEASIRVLLKSGLVEEVRLRNWFRFVNQGNAPKDCALFLLPL